MSKKFQVIQTEERHVIRRPIEVNGVSSEIKCTGVLNTERGTYKISCPVTTKHTDRNNAQVTDATFNLQKMIMSEMSDFLMLRVKDLNLEGGDPSQMSLGLGDGGSDDEGKDSYPAKDNRKTLQEVAAHYEQEDAKKSVFKVRKGSKAV